MRKWLGIALVVAGCSGDSLKADVGMFCDLPTGPGPTLIEIGPYVAEHARTDDLRQLIGRLPGGKMTRTEFANEFQKLMKRAGVERCKTLDALLHVTAPREEDDEAGSVTNAGAAPLPPPSASPSPPPQTVAPTLLEASRIAGATTIVPDKMTKAEIARSGKDRLVGSYKLCLSVDGAVASVHQLKSTGFAAYDAKIQRELRTWRYRPYMVNAKAVPVCYRARLLLGFEAA